MTDFAGWAIVELMGHVRLAGYVTEEEHFGTKLGRIDVHSGEQVVTQFFGGNSVYRVTPTTEEVARRIAEPTRAPVALLGHDDEDDDVDLCADEDYD